MRVSIAGAGQVGRSIARELMANGHTVTLIEKDLASINPDIVVGAEWHHSDACELSSLEDIDLEQFDVAIAATGDDKVNLVHCLLAKTEFGVPRTVARVNHPNNEWLFDHRWGVDAAVSTPRLMAALVDEAVTDGRLVRLHTLHDAGMSLSEAHVSEGSAYIGKAVGELELPDEVSLVAVGRNGVPCHPRIDDRLKAGDKLFFLCSDAAEAELYTLFKDDE